MTFSMSTYLIIWAQPPAVFYKKGLLENVKKFTGKKICRSLFFSKVAELRSSTTLLQKETPTHTPKQLFFCGFCDIFINTYFIEYLEVTTSGSTAFKLI